MTQALTDFKLDTSGVVYVNGVAHTWEGSSSPVYSVGLSPFVQGHVRGLFDTLVQERWPDLLTGVAAIVLDGPQALSTLLRFDMLAPETLARIIEDCAMFRRYWPDGSEDTTAGLVFWRLRQQGSYVGGLIVFRPQTVSLNDDGKVVFQ